MVRVEVQDALMRANPCLFRQFLEGKRAGFTVQRLAPTLALQICTGLLVRGVTSTRLTQASCSSRPQSLARSKGTGS